MKKLHLLQFTCVEKFHIIGEECKECYPWIEAFTICLFCLGCYSILQTLFSLLNYVFRNKLGYCWRPMIYVTLYIANHLRDLICVVTFVLVIYSILICMNFEYMSYNVKVKRIDDSIHFYNLSQFICGFKAFMRFLKRGFPWSIYNPYI